MGPLFDVFEDQRNRCREPIGIPRGFHLDATEMPWARKTRLRGMGFLRGPAGKIMGRSWWMVLEHHWAGWVAWVGYLQAITYNDCV